MHYNIRYVIWIWYDIIEQLRIRKAAVAKSDNPEFNQLMDAFCSGGLEAFGDVVNSKIQFQNTPTQYDDDT